jgi:hypothetical protein
MVIGLCLADGIDFQQLYISFTPYFRKFDPEITHVTSQPYRNVTVKQTDAAELMIDDWVESMTRSRVDKRQTVEPRRKKGRFFMSGKKILIALSAALALGTLGAASSVQANDNSGDYHGGSVVSGSSAVNPAYHPRWFANRGGKAYAFVAPSGRAATQPARHHEDNYGPEAGKE